MGITVLADTPVLKQFVWSVSLHVLRGSDTLEKCHVSRFCGLQEIVEGMKGVIPELPFSIDCFKKCRHVNIEVMRLVRLSRISLPPSLPHPHPHAMILYASHSCSTYDTLPTMQTLQSHVSGVSSSQQIAEYSMLMHLRLQACLVPEDNCISSHIAIRVLAICRESLGSQIIIYRAET